MHTYADIIGRLEQCIADIGDNLHRPLSANANAYRIAAENICKAILFERQTTNDRSTLDKLSSDASIVLEATEPQRDVAQFRADIKYIQNVGNIFSHDGPATRDTNNQSQESVFRSLAQALRVAFFGEAEIVRPKLPPAMRKYFSNRLIHRSDITELTIAEVAQICYPKNKTSARLTKRDWHERLAYEYVSIDLGGNLSKGLLFLRHGSSLERTILDCTTHLDFNRPSAFEIVTPRVYRRDGKQINRLKSIQEKVRDLLPTAQGWNVHVKYFDDFAWEYSLPADFKHVDTSPQLTHHFIRQELQLHDHSSLTRQHANTVAVTDYIDAAITNPQEYAAVHVIVGQAGIGKTTLCDSIAHHIHAKHRKKALLISVTDFRDLNLSRAVDSVQALYTAACEHGLINEAASIESKNFEIVL